MPHAMIWRVMIMASENGRVSLEELSAQINAMADSYNVAFQLDG